jgi:hypothetical protein
MTGLSEQAGRSASAAGEITTLAEDVAQGVRQFHHRLGEAVRGRIAELDRRTATRHVVDIPARLDGPGGAEGRLADVSTGGASWRGSAPGFQGGMLVVGGLPPLSVTVVSHEPHEIHLAFADAEQGAMAVARLVPAAPRGIAATPQARAA